MMFTEVIPKAQINPILETQISFKGYEIIKNFNYTDTNLGSSGKRGLAIYVKENLICREIKFRGIFEDHVWVEISLKNKDALLDVYTGALLMINHQQYRARQKFAN